ncbi:ATP-binding protein [Clostridium sp. C2-6-12]|uniref:ATP-binding protein n=1 Tax=Clostridium sp. C2-6-12 TaxID=2698832 RepID=UPI00136A3DFB|nr:ATP-binding protein [Clostridium sp. C2-6-12]
MSKLLAEQIFKPGSFPEYTYVSRESLDIGINYEVRLKQALKISGCLTSIIGPSKMGKTVLCEKVIDLDNLVEVSGVDFKLNNDFWTFIGTKAGLPMSGEFIEGKTVKDNISDDLHYKKDKFVLTKDRVIDYFKENGKVLVLDDFHYAPEDIQLHIAQQLKDAIRKEFKAIVVSLPHRADDAIRKNADLTGRLSLINIENWKNDELEQIAKKGFEKLDIKIDDELVKNIAIESLTSPQLMQYICLSICTLLDTDNSKITQIPKEVLERAYKFTTVNFEYSDVLKTLLLGPNPRGNKRKIYKTESGKELDIYGLIVEAVSINPPSMGLDIDEMKYRIDKLIINEDKKPDKQQIRDSLNKLQSIIDEKENIYKVFEWKDSMLYILDPLFLFYLRWGNHK